MERYEDWLREVLTITYDLFPGAVEIELVKDPDVEETYIVFVVGFGGCTQSQIRHQLMWHQQVEKLTKKDICSNLRLSVIPRGKFLGTEMKK